MSGSLRPAPTAFDRRPKSRGRQALDAALFLAAAVVVGWAGAHRLGDGVIALRRGPEVSLAHQPGLFWTLAVVHLLIAAGCLALSAIAVRALLKPRAPAPDARP